MHKSIFCIVLIDFVHTTYNKIGGATYMSKSKDVKNDKKNNTKGTKNSNPKQDTNTMEGK